MFTAADQKYTYEVKKADINQQRVLCTRCWNRSNEIADELTLCQETWAASKNSLRRDRAFLARWRMLLIEREEYVAYKPDTATKKMLAKLVGDAE